MKAYKCDICERFYCDLDADNRDYQVTKWNAQTDIYMPIDICTDCYASLRAWMKMRKVAMTGKEVSDGPNKALAYTD